jgi:hypothetical protein
MARDHTTQATFNVRAIKGIANVSGAGRFLTDSPLR